MKKLEIIMKIVSKDIEIAINILAIKYQPTLWPSPTRDSKDRSSQTLAKRKVYFLYISSSYRPELCYQRCYKKRKYRPG